MLKNEESGLETLRISNFKLGTEKNMELLQKIMVKNKKLKKVEIHDSSFSKENFNIDTFNISEIIIMNCNLTYINYLPLNKLNLSFNNISSDGLKKIAKLNGTNFRK